MLLCMVQINKKLCPMLAMLKVLMFTLRTRISTKFKMGLVAEHLITWTSVGISLAVGWIQLKNSACKRATMILNAKCLGIIQFTQIHASSTRRTTETIIMVTALTLIQLIPNAGL